MADKNSREVLRRCVSCGEMKDKRDLIRVVRAADGKIMADPSGKANGRGAYICRNPQCIDKAVSGKALARSLKCGISRDALDALSETISAAD